MVVRAGGDYVQPFCGERDVMQGGLLSPTIFNVAVKALVHHWEYLMIEGAGGDNKYISSGNKAAQPSRRTIRVHYDRQRQTEEAVKEIERIMGAYPPHHKESWHRMKEWYRAALNCSPPSALVTLKQITAERMDLYCHMPPSGKNIPVSVEAFQVEISLPMEGEVELAVK